MNIMMLKNMKRLLCVAAVLAVATASFYVQRGTAQTAETPAAEADDFSAYRAVMEMKKELQLDGAERTLDYVKNMGQEETEEGNQLSFPRFAVLDADGDGRREVVIQECIGDGQYGSLILDAQDEKVYGYELWLRAYMQLKVDGSFAFSSGAQDNGVGTLTLDRGQITYNTLGESRTQEDGGAAYFVDDKPSDEEGFQAVWNAHTQKEDVRWYDWTAENLDAVLGQTK